jgi:hypothetical protein
MALVLNWADQQQPRVAVCRRRGNHAQFLVAPSTSAQHVSAELTVRPAIS